MKILELVIKDEKLMGFAQIDVEEEYQLKENEVLAEGVDLENFYKYDFENGELVVNKTKEQELAKRKEKVVKNKEKVVKYKYKKTKLDEIIHDYFYKNLAEYKTEFDKIEGE